MPISQVFSPFLPLASICLLSSLYSHHAYLVPFTRSSFSAHYLWVLQDSVPSPFCLHSALLRIFSLFHVSPNTFGLRWCFSVTENLHVSQWLRTSLVIFRPEYWYLLLLIHSLVFFTSHTQHIWIRTSNPLLFIVLLMLVLLLSIFCSHWSLSDLSKTQIWFYQTQA